MELTMDHACLHKIPKVWGFRELPGWWPYGGARRAACRERAWKLCTPSHLPCPVHLFRLDIHLYPLSCPLTWVVNVSELFSCILRAALAKQANLRSGSCRTESFTCGTWCYVRVVSELLNCRPPSWRHRELVIVGKNPNIFGDQKMSEVYFV